MMGSSLYDWKLGQPHGLDLQTSEVSLIHADETKDKLKKFEYFKEV